ncbi:unnamed protein product [Closterium sp. Naga37s-1]|nr:unnamed protein product [Closterium sp. Naga37s-1]
MPSLRNVYAAQNFFSGGLPQRPAAYAALLLSLELGNNRRFHSPPLSSLSSSPDPSGPIPAFCQGKQALTILSLASNALSGPPAPLSSPSCSASLALLYLSSNRLSGPIPATVSSFTRLKLLTLDRNALTGTIPAGVSNMKWLQGLGLSYNRVSGKIPAVWPARIQQVRLAGNRLRGAVPTALSKLKRGAFKPGNPNLCGAPLPACA